MAIFKFMFEGLQLINYEYQPMNNVHIFGLDWRTILGIDLSKVYY